MVERYQRKPTQKQVVGVDLGMKRVVSDSEGHSFGEYSDRLRASVEQGCERRRRLQKQNACLAKKGLPEVEVPRSKAEAYARCEIGRALNQVLDALPPNVGVAVERLSVGEMRFDYKRGNRWLRASQLGYARDRLKFKLEERGVRYRSVQAAYSSQQCSACGFTCRLNRLSQAEFHCLWCGFTCNADPSLRSGQALNAARVIAERFGDGLLNCVWYRQVEGVLLARFLLGAGLPTTEGYPELGPSLLGSLQVGRSPTSGPDTPSLRSGQALSKEATRLGNRARKARPYSGQSAQSTKTPTSGSPSVSQVSVVSVTTMMEQ